MALAEMLHGEEEVQFEGGRIDVMTDEYAIEIDWPHKWHEGLGQALHYADAMKRTGALALISYSKNPEAMRQTTRDKMAIVERQCSKNGIHLMVLFQGDPEAEEEPEPDAPLPPCWLNSKSMSIHWPGCRYFEKTAQGRRAWPNEGRICGQCFKEGELYTGPRSP